MYLHQPVFQNNAVEGRKPLTGAQREELFLEAVYNTYGAAYGFTEAEAYDFAINGGLDYGDLAAWDGEEYDWPGVVTNRNAPVTNVSVSATGGDNVSSFYASLGYNKTEATTIVSDFKRITGSLNYSRKFSDKVRFAVNTNVSNTFQNAYLEQAAYFANPNLTKYFMAPWYKAYNEDGSPNPQSLWLCSIPFTLLKTT
jgi:hypothetical protein